jgi:hypothetical protein
MGAIRIALDLGECACIAVCACILGPRAQEFVEMFAIDHANKAVLDRDIDLPPCGRDHARGIHLGHDLFVGDEEIFYQTRWNRPAAGFDPSVTVDKSDLVTGPCEVFCSGGP